MYHDTTQCYYFLRDISAKKSNTHYNYNPLSRQEYQNPCLIRVNTSNTVFALTYIIISNLLKRNNIAFFSTENLAIKLIKFTQ